jgi:hypothetical protein
MTPEAEDTDENFCSDLQDAWATAEWLQQLYEASDGDSSARVPILIKLLASQLQDLVYRHVPGAEG